VGTQVSPGDLKQMMDGHCWSVRRHVDRYARQVMWTSLALVPGAGGATPGPEAPKPPAHKPGGARAGRVS